MWLTILLCLILFVLTFCIRYGPPVYEFFRLRRRLMETVPLPKPCKNWLEGHGDPGPTNVRERYLQWTRACPRVFLQLLSVFPLVSVHHPESVTDALRASSKKPEYLYGFLKDFMGEGLVVSSGKRWARDRRLVAKAFQSEMLRLYVETYKSAGMVLLEKLLGRVGRVTEVSEDLALVTYDIILQCAMGRETNCQLHEDPNHPDMKYLENGRWLSNALTRRYGNLLYHNNFIFFNFTAYGREYVRRRKELLDYCRNVVEERQAELAEGEMDTRTMLDAMLSVRDEDGEGLRTCDIVDHVNTFLDAGHDTTTYTLEWMLYYLARDQAIQDKCREEIHQVLDECGGIGGFHHGDLDKLRYVTKVMNETLRIAAIGGCFARVLEKSSKVDSYQLPADTVIQVTVIGLHHNPEIWPEPERFDPDRFSAENCLGRHPNAFIPFGAGIRTCIGKQMAMDEIRVLIMIILSRTSVHLADASAPPPDWVMEVVSKPKPPIKVIFTEL